MRVLFLFVAIMLRAITTLIILLPSVHLRPRDKSPYHGTEVLEPVSRRDCAHLRIWRIRLSQNLNTDTKSWRHVEVLVKNTRNALQEEGSFADHSLLGVELPSWRRNPLPILVDTRNLERQISKAVVAIRIVLVVHPAFKLETRRRNISNHPFRLPLRRCRLPKSLRAVE